MKKTFVSVCALFLSMYVLNAQFSQGNLMLGVSSSTNLIGIYAENTGPSGNLFFAGLTTLKWKDGEEEKAKSFNLSPTAGYFIIDNLVAGINLSIAAVDYSDEAWKQSIVSIGPYVRYYYPLQKVNPFAEIYVGVGGVKETYSDSGGGENSYKTGLTLYGGGAGVSIPLGGAVQMDIMAGYSASIMKEKDNEEYNDELKQGNLGFKIGFQVFLDLGD